MKWKKCFWRDLERAERAEARESEKDRGPFGQNLGEGKWGTENLGGGQGGTAKKNQGHRAKARGDVVTTM